MKNTKHARKQLHRRAKMLAGKGSLTEAKKLYITLIQQSPTNYSALLELSRLNRRLGLLADAEYCATRILKTEPDHAEALLEYGLILHSSAKSSEAIHTYRRYLAQSPKDADGHYYLATACLDNGQTVDAIKHYQLAISLRPDHFMALNNLSALMTNRGNIEQSLELLANAEKLQPSSYQVLINQARAHLFSGNVEKSVEVLGRMVLSHPDNHEGYSKYLLSLNYLADKSPLKISSEHISWAKRFTASIQRYPFHNNAIDLDRNLRIGYVSPDLRNHSVAHFIASILEHHNKDKFTIYAYADCPNPDASTFILKSYCDEWRWTHTMSADEICESIRSDKIDILVDLAGHTGSNRLAVFAHKPAPLQISYLGYPNTTGLTEIDYRLTDPVADPENDSDDLYTEKLLRLPNSFLCYRPPSDTPDIQIERSDYPGKVIFGSFNNLGKVTPLVIKFWAKLLYATDNSILLLKNKATSDSYTKTRLLKLFSDYGITHDQLIFESANADTASHLDRYNTIDIALDTFPYNGTTTTCEALWMGRPVVTLYGKTHASRVSASILTQLGLTDFIANSLDEYIEIAARLATQPKKLATFKQTIRSIMLASPLCDAIKFTQQLEFAYSQIWHQYCNEHNQAQ